MFINRNLTNTKKLSPIRILNGIIAKKVLIDEFLV